MPAFCGVALIRVKPRRFTWEGEEFSKASHRVEVCMTDHATGAMRDPKEFLKKVEGFAWGLFFIWVGVVLLAELGWGVGLLGVGILVLGGQMARKQMALQLETFWLVIGTFFVLGGIWSLLGIRVSLMPVVSILAGIALLVSALFAKPRHG
jgi:hypothetical protein